MAEPSVEIDNAPTQTSTTTPETSKLGLRLKLRRTISRQHLLHPGYRREQRQKDFQANHQSESTSMPDAKTKPVDSEAPQPAESPKDHRNGDHPADLLRTRSTHAEHETLAPEKPDARAHLAEILESHPELAEIPGFVALADRMIVVNEEFSTNCSTEERFHDEFHSLAFIDAGETFIQKAIDGQNPLQIETSLKNYNQMHGTNITLSELKQVMGITGLLHDVGNLGKPRVETNPDGSNKLVVDYFTENIDGDDKHVLRSKQYDPDSGVVVEELIAENADSIMEAYGIFSDRPDLQALVKTMILDTQFPAPNESPFNVLIHVTDQVGQAYKNKKGLKSTVIGLNQEWVTEDQTYHLGSEPGNLGKSRVGADIEAMHLFHENILGYHLSRHIVALSDNPHRKPFDLTPEEQAHRTQMTEQIKAILGPFPDQDIIDKIRQNEKISNQLKHTDHAQFAQNPNAIYDSVNL